MRKTRSATGADKAAKHCLAAGKHAMAVEFLLLARREREAFELAEVHHALTLTLTLTPALTLSLVLTLTRKAFALVRRG